MSSPETAAADQANASSNSSNEGLQQPKDGKNKNASGIHAEKTISCVSCRKRKLKCDRLKPKCGTCIRLRHDCEYPERRRNIGSKRRNMKDLEARLAQVETQLVTETSKNAQLNMSTEPDWNTLSLDMHVDFEDDAFMGTDFNLPSAQLPAEGFYTQEMVNLGLEEALPPDEMVEELHRVYFERLHLTMPMLHQNRYMASLNLPAHMRPPIYLRYAIWASAATVSDNYSQYDDLFYERARKYIEIAEMKGHGETFVTVATAQAWALICSYEAKKTYFTRAWMSTGRMSRLSYMLGLHRLDGEIQDVKKILAPAKDWIELEERRRTFWVGFYCDRWASSGTGWPMSIDESIISTNLPVSEEAFELGNIEIGISLQDALTPAGASQISPFGGVVLSACLFGHNFNHLHQRGPNERPDDLQNGEFWKRHRNMDNILSNTFMFLPDHLRLPFGLRDMNVVFLHMNIHAATICLHQAAILTAKNHGIDTSFIKRCRARSLMAAEEITTIMRLITHLNASSMNSWVGFCLYVASSVFIQDMRIGTKRPESYTNLEFLLAAMKAIGKWHTITQHFTAQVEIDIENSGIHANRHPIHTCIDMSDPFYNEKETFAPLDKFFGNSEQRPLSGVLPIRMSNGSTRTVIPNVADPLNLQSKSEMHKVFPIYGAGVHPVVADPNSRKSSGNESRLSNVLSRFTWADNESSSSASATGYTPPSQHSQSDATSSDQTMINEFFAQQPDAVALSDPWDEIQESIPSCPFTQLFIAQTR